MGWKAPTATVIDPGEIPGKGRMSDAQSARLDEFAPTNDVGKWLGAGGGDMDDFQAAALDQIVAMGDQHEEIMALIDDLLENVKDPSTIINVFADDYEAVLQTKYDASNLTASFDDTLKVAQLRFVLPAAFYFGIGDPKGTGDINVVIAPIACWEDTKTLEKQDLVAMVVPEFLEYVDDFIYEFKDMNMSPSEVRQELLNRGFVENHDVAA